MKKASILLLFCLVVFFSISSNAQTNCTYTLNPQSVEVIAGPDRTRSFNVVTQEGCTWTAVSNQNWIVIASGSSGIGTGTVVFSVGVGGFEGFPRQGSITVNNQNFLVTQRPFCSEGVISTPTVSVPSSGGSGTVQYSTTSRCSYTYSSDVPWITSFGSANVGSVNIPYTVEANTGPARTGTISIKYNVVPEQIYTITINQAAGQSCTYSLNPTNITVTAAGGGANFALTTQTGCSWTAASNVNWITVLPASGTNSASLSYSVEPNSGAARSGTITVGGQTFSVFQNAQPPPIEYITASGRVMSRNEKPVRGALVTFLNTRTGEARTVLTNQFGYFHFGNIERGQAYNVTITHKRYKFSGLNTVAYYTGALIQIFTADPE
jgi:hypothetical protein